MSDESDDSQLTTEGLDKLIKALTGKLPKVHVGILGETNPRSGKVTSNASLGAVHEFGSPARNIPMRSFLRVPIAEHLQEYLVKSGAFTKQTLQEVMEKGTIGPWLTRTGFVGETIVLDAFDTSGFGKWKPWAPGYSNNSGQLLVDTKQLRDSITSRVVE